MLSACRLIPLILLLASCHKVFPYPEAPSGLDAGHLPGEDALSLDLGAKDRGGPIDGKGVMDRSSPKDLADSETAGDLGLDSTPPDSGLDIPYQGKETPMGDGPLSDGPLIVSGDGPLPDGPLIVSPMINGFGFGGGGDDQAYAVATDATGSLYVTGSFTGSISILIPASGQIRTLTHKGAKDGFVAKYSSDGDLQWAQRFGGIADDEGLGIAVLNGMVHVTGYCTGSSVQLGDDGGSSTDEIDCMGQDILWARLNASTGDFLPSFHYPSSSSSRAGIGRGIAAVNATSGGAEVYLTGSVVDGVDFGKGPVLPSSIDGTKNIFVAKFPQDGSLVDWAKVYASTNPIGMDVGHGLAVSNDVVYVTGETGGPIAFGQGVQSGAGNQDLFLAAFETASGNNLWSKVVGGPGIDVGYGLAKPDSSGVGYLTGQVTGSFSFEGTPLTGGVGADILIAEFSTANGNFSWAKSMGGTGEDQGRGIVRGQNGALYVAGSHAGIFSIDGQPVSGNGGQDIFLSSFTPDSPLHWIAPLGSAGDDGLRGIATSLMGATEKIVTVGHFADSLSLDASNVLQSSGGADCLILTFQD